MCMNGGKVVTYGKPGSGLTAGRFVDSQEEPAATPSLVASLWLWRTEKLSLQGKRKPKRVAQGHTRKVFDSVRSGFLSNVTKLTEKQSGSVVTGDAVRPEPGGGDWPLIWPESPDAGVNELEAFSFERGAARSRCWIQALTPLRAFPIVMAGRF